MAEDEASSSKPGYLDPSPLGTKEYWDALYTRDISTHATQPSHIGQTWFDDSGAEEKTLAYLEDNADELGLDKERTSFLDLGTGNASMLLALRDDGWTGGIVGLWGCDYSQESVELARKVVAADAAAAAADDGVEDGDESAEAEKQGSGGADVNDGNTTMKSQIHLIQHDIFGPSPSEYPSEGFDVVLDKGTLDAISLSDEILATGKRGCESYADAVRPLIKRGGLLLITSCNWTETELRGWIEGPSAQGNGKFSMVGKIKYPAFKFGGQEGTTLVGMCWRKE